MSDICNQGKLLENLSKIQQVMMLLIEGRPPASIGRHAFGGAAAPYQNGGPVRLTRFNHEVMERTKCSLITAGNMFYSTEW